MALFLVLFAVGRTDLEKFKKMAQSFRQEFGNSSTEVVSFGGSGDNPVGNGGAGVLAADRSPSPLPTTTVFTEADQALAELLEHADAADLGAESNQRSPEVSRRGLLGVWLLVDRVGRPH